MTRLGTYRGDAALRTWVFRIAANHLLTVRRGRVERQDLSSRRSAPTWPTG